MSQPASSLFSLSGKTVWVVGGAGYLGQATVRELAALGANVRCVDLGNNAESFVRAAGLAERVTPASLDVRDAEAVERLVSEWLNTEGTPWGLVNLAFSSTAKTLDDLSEADFDAANHGNLTATFLLVRRVGGAMAAAGGGSLVLVSSVYGSVAPDPALYEAPMPKNPIEYGVGKAGIIQMTRYLAVHWGRQNVRCNCVSPGPFPRPSVREAHPAFVARLARKTPLGRVGEAPELAGAVAFLLSDAASFVTGHNLAVDGGWTSW